MNNAKEELPLNTHRGTSIHIDNDNNCTDLYFMPGRSQTMLNKRVFLWSIGETIENERLLCHMGPIFWPNGYLSEFVFFTAFLFSCLAAMFTHLNGVVAVAGDWMFCGRLLYAESHLYYNATEIDWSIWTDCNFISRALRVRNWFII